MSWLEHMRWDLFAVAFVLATVFWVSVLVAAVWMASRPRRH